MDFDLEYKYLNNINSPSDLKKVPLAELPVVVNEVREFMIDTITKTGGHFGAGLGIVELTVALHYIYDTPKDKIIFDVGHQGYPHKILTGRRDQLHTIRQKDGLSGFLKPAESPYDAFGAGHASTSISAGLGMATARDLMHDNYKVISVIGDGAMTGGMAFEAMNNAGVQKRDFLLILNDNNVSIDANVSAFSNYFNEFFASSMVQNIRENVWNMTGKMDEFGDRLRKIASRLEGGVKSIITPGALFESLGFKYFGPINGNNLHKMVKILKLIKDIKGPVFLHVVTQKGKGYKPAEADSHYFHAIGKIDKSTGKSVTKKNTQPLYQDIFGEAMLELCRKDDRLIAVSAAMCDGTGLDILQEEYPERVIDVGIAESHAVTYAAGMAMQGMKPVLAIYSTFLQRAYDNIIHDCALQKLHVIFAIDRAGLVGSDGPTHHGTFDLVYLRSIPNMIVMAPKDEQELRDMLYTAANDVKDACVAIRYPRGTGAGIPSSPMKSIKIGQSETLTKGDDIAVFAIGKTLINAQIAAEALKEKGISVELVNARFVKPLDYAKLDDLCKRFNTIVTIEDGQEQGGFGSAVLEYVNKAHPATTEVKIIGIPDKFIEHGTQEELYADLKLDPKGLSERIESLVLSQKLTKDLF